MTLEEFKRNTAHMKRGWVAMDECGRYCWFSLKPTAIEDDGLWYLQCFGQWHELPFDIDPVPNWKESCFEVGVWCLMDNM